MATWSTGGNLLWSGDASYGVPSVPSTRFSSLGLVIGGETEPAGTALPASAGIVTISTDAETYVRISGTAAEPGDVVLHTFSGNPITAPESPAKRYESARVVSSGIIELALSATNPDLTASHWLLVKKGA